MAAAAAGPAARRRAGGSPTPGSPGGAGNWKDRFEPQTAKGKRLPAIAGDRVIVSVRIRPLLETQQRTDGDGENFRVAFTGNPVTNTVDCDDGKGRKKDFQYDSVFTAGQDEVYDCIGRPMLREAFGGYNVTLFAYGQTGSGKTYTIQGLPGAGLPKDCTPEKAAREAGLVPRLCRDCFEVIQEKLDDDDGLEIKVTLSYMEVYNEQVRDLLAHRHRHQEPESLEIHETPDKRIDVRGLSHHTVIGSERVLQLIAQGNSNRQVAETKMNECSSRSHSILQLHVVQRYENPSADKRDCESLINIVDLAGSERQSKTGTEGDQFKEAKHINHSLLMLGRALNSFSEKGKSAHVPLRESKLTRLLSESFGGNSKTWMLATASPSAYNFSESMSTLNYAQSAKNITNNARQNRLARAMELKELKDDNARLSEAFDAEKRRAEQLQRELERLTAETERLRKSTDPAAIDQLTRENAALEAENSSLRATVKEKQQAVELAHGDTQELEARLAKEKRSVPSDTPRTVDNLVPGSSRGVAGGGLTQPQSGMYIGRAKISLRNIIEQTSSYLTLPLTNESGVEGGHGAVLVVNIYPVDAKGSAALERKGGIPSEKDLLGQRVDFVVHIIGAKGIPQRYCKTVYCKYVYKWAEKDSYKTTDVHGTPEPEFDFKKRFAFSKLNQGLVEYFRSDNVITFEVIGSEIASEA
eukprot:TRINITY_DN535_c0_g1_i3.p1 TRINITY_DN535_c0_g1~~TRINITY_DN535_c0_g1_i3.p1  ORF type:complete len:698 (+),score=221.80 TRINITY_DN535_c0_g1_i3:159-2252(+)